MPNRFRSVVALCAFLTALPGALSGQPADPCAGHRGGTAPEATLLPIAPPSGAGAGTLAFAVCLAATIPGDGIGGYRGEIAYDPGLLELVDIRRGPGGSRFEDATTPGLIVFAGVSASGFEEPLVLQLVLRLRRNGARPDRPTLSLGEVSSVRGLDLSSRTRVIAPLPSEGEPP